MNRNRGVVMLLGASVLWSFAGICVKSMSWNGFAITGIRGLIAAAVMLGVIRKPRLPRGKYQILAVFSYTGLICMTVIATKMTTAANAILLQYTSPVYSAVLGYYVLGEKVTRRDKISVLMIFAGLFIFFYDGLAGGHLLGDLVALLSGVCFAAMNVFMRADSRVSPLQNVFWGNLAAFAFMFPFFGHVEWSIKNIELVLFLGIFQLGLAYVLYSKAILYVGALEATVTTVLEAILNPIWVMILGNERIGPATMAGGIIVLAAVVIRGIPGEQYLRAEKVKE